MSDDEKLVQVGFKVAKFVLDDINKAVMENRELYNNRTHFIVASVIRELRRLETN